MNQLFWKIFLIVWGFLVLVAGGLSLLVVWMHAEAHSAGHADHISDIWLPILAILLVSALFSGLFSGWLSGPLTRLQGGLARVARGDFGVRLSGNRSRLNELGELATNFDRMSERLEASIGSQRRLLHDVSHELRSPLARLQVAVGLARKTPERIADSLDRIEKETQRVDRLVGEILLLSRFASGARFGGDVGEAINLSEMLQEVVDDASFEVADKIVRLQGAGGPFPMRANVELLRRAFDNILRNALRYTPPGQTVVVEVRPPVRANNRMEVTVDVIDSGPGVPPAALGRIFEPFFRVGDSSAGFGLGLAIARHAVEAHHGRIGAQLADTGGLCVGITLPFDGSA